MDLIGSLIKINYLKDKGILESESAPFLFQMQIHHQISVKSFLDLCSKGDGRRISWVFLDSATNFKEIPKLLPFSSINDVWCLKLGR